LALLLAGGFGNLIDRVLHDGSVTDFLNVGIGPIRTGIF
jgi:signal peptidase II